MTHFPPQATQAIADFTNNLQMQPVPPAQDGSYSFAFDQAGVFSISPSDDGRRAILALKQPKPHTKTGDALFAFLGLAQRDPETQTPISAGMVGGALVLAANVRLEHLNLQKIEACLDRLILLHRSAP